MKIAAAFVFGLLVALAIPVVAECPPSRDVDVGLLRLFDEWIQTQRNGEPAYVLTEVLQDMGTRQLLEARAELQRPNLTDEEILAARMKARIAVRLYRTGEAVTCGRSRG